MAWENFKKNISPLDAAVCYVKYKVQQ